MSKIVFGIELLWFIGREEFLNTFKEEESEVHFTFFNQKIKSLPNKQKTFTKLSMRYNP